jgi:hypothetical protein
LELFPFLNQIFKNLILFVLYFKNYKRQMVSWNCKHVQHVKIYIPCNFWSKFDFPSWSYCPFFKFLTHVRFLILLTVFELLPKTCNFTICSIFSKWPCWLVHGITGHNFETRRPSDDSDQVWFPLVLYFQRRRFLKKFTTYDGRRRRRQVMAIAHMTLWVRWAKKGNNS